MAHVSEKDSVLEGRTDFSGSRKTDDDACMGYQAAGTTCAVCEAGRPGSVAPGHYHWSAGRVRRTPFLFPCQLLLKPCRHRGISKHGIMLHQHHNQEGRPSSEVAPI